MTLRRNRRQDPSRGRRVALAGALSLAFLTVLGSGLMDAPAAATSPTGTPGGPTNTVTFATTFDGASTSTHDSAGTALPTTFDHPFSLQVAWSSHGGVLGTPSLVTVTGARVSLLLLNFATFTQETDLRNPAPAYAGTINMTLDFTQDRYLVEGVYLMSVTLLGQGGAGIASQTFYFHATATYHLVALNLGLAALILYEIVGVLTEGRRRAPKSAPHAPPAGGAP